MSTDRELEAVFHFGGGGLFVKGDALGRSIEFDRDGRRLTIRLPGSDDLEKLPPRAPAERTVNSAIRWNLNPQTGEFLGAIVDRFEVRVQVTRDGGAPLNGLVEEAFPLAVEAAERFLSWMRTRGGQYWLPARPEGPRFVGYGELVLAGTDEQVDSSVRWSPAYVLTSGDDEDAASAQQIDDALSKVRADADPPIEDVLLADARTTVSEPPIASSVERGRRDAARVVLLAAIAAEVKIKRTLMDKARPEFHDLLNVILENPRDVTIATGQLLDKPMKAALGVSLRDRDSDLFKAVTQRLFPLRNRVAHGGHQPALADAQHAFATAQRLFAWLDSL